MRTAWGRREDAQGGVAARLRPWRRRLASEDAPPPVHEAQVERRDTDRVGEDHEQREHPRPLVLLAVTVDAVQ